MRITIEPHDEDEAVDEATNLANRTGAELVGAQPDQDWHTKVPPAVTERADGKPRMTDAQRDRLWTLCGSYNVPFREDDYHRPFDLPDGYVAGWVGGTVGWGGTTLAKQTIYVGVSPEGESSS